MTELNLHDQPVKKSPKGERKWSLTVPTKSRAELIHLSIFLAKAIETRFFHDYSDVPIFIIPGYGGAGKSMMVEAMMKTLLDQCDPLDMLAPDAPNEMFIEEESAEACSRYCYAAGTTDGMPVAYGFDRITENSGDRSNGRLTATFKRAVENTSPRPSGGAIFASNGGKDYTDPWLVTDLRNGKGEKKWLRETTITVNSPKLKDSPHFKMCWDRLNYMVNNNCIEMLDEDVAIQDAKNRKVKLVLDDNYIKQRSLDPELQLLKLALKNPDGFGVETCEILDIVAGIADSGDVRRIRHFLAGIDPDDYDSIAHVVEKTKKATFVKIALTGDYDIQAGAIYSGMRSSKEASKIVSQLLSPSECAKKTSLYNSLFDALKKNKDDRANTIIHLAAYYLEGDAFKAFITQKPCPKRHSSSLLDYLCQEGRFNMLEKLSVNAGFSEIAADLLSPAASAIENSLYDLLFDALENKKLKEVRDFFRFARVLDTSDLISLLTEKPCPERYKHTLLERLCQEGRSDVFKILSEGNGFQSVFSRLLSPTECPKEGALYDLIFDALENEDNETPATILRLASFYLEEGAFKALLTEKPCIERHQSTLLEYIYQNERWDIFSRIDPHNFLQLLWPLASAEKGSLYDLLFDAMAGKKDDCATAILELTRYMDADQLKTFLTEKPCPDRHEQSLLVYLCSEGRSDILEIISHNYRFRDVFPEILSRAECAKEGSLYDLIFDAMEKKNDNCSITIFKFAAMYLRRDAFKALLTEKPCPERHEQSLLEYIWREERPDIFRILINNSGFKDALSQLLRSSASAQKGSLYDSLLDALATGKDDWANSIIECAEECCEFSVFRSFLTERPCPDRHECSLLEHLLQKGRFDLLKKLSNNYRFQDILTDFLTPAICTKEGSLYDLLFDALKKKDNDGTRDILTIVSCLNPATLNEFLKQRLCPDRHEFSVLEYLYREQSLDTLEVLSRKIDRYDNRKLDSDISKLIHHLRYDTSSELPPYDEVIKPQVDIERHERERKNFSVSGFNGEHEISNPSFLSRIFEKIWKTPKPENESSPSLKIRTLTPGP